MLTNRLFTTSIFILLTLSLIGQNTPQRGPERFNDTEYESFRDYLGQNLWFDPIVGLDYTGILLPGIVLDSSGKILNVFSLNSLHSRIDNMVLDLIEQSAGNWRPSVTPNAEIIIVPINFYLGGVENKLDTSKFKLPVYDEIMITALSGGRPMDHNSYIKTSLMKKRLERQMKKANYEKASETISELLRREPLNLEYYRHFVNIENSLGNNENACHIINFLESNFYLDSTFKEKVDIICK